MRKASWVWLNKENRADEYVRFYDVFECEGKEAVIRLSCDGDYLLFVNGQRAAFGQYASFPDSRVYDEIDIGDFVRAGKNEIAALVWYGGHDSMTYAHGDAGFLYEVRSGGETVCFSGAHTLCRLAPDYVSHREKEITAQLGLSFCYDARRADEFGGAGFSPEGFVPATVIAPAGKLYARPNKKLVLERTSYATLVDGDRRVYDLGREAAGVLHLCFRAPSGEKVTVVFGEYVAADGNLLRKYESQDYSVELVGNGEYFEFVGYLRRIGCRYFQVLSDSAEIRFIGINETTYPLKILPYDTDSSLYRRIYEVSLRTLRLCMHEHYEDCPWREQVLYPLDSRNQMLCGYYAFGEYEFARSNLWLMSRAPRRKGLLPSSMPSGITSYIPFYSLIFVLQMGEYAAHSDDFTLARENLGLLESLLDVFRKNKDAEGLVKEFAGEWNFYEWTDGMDGKGAVSGNKISLPLNAFYLLALDAMNALYRGLGEKKNFSSEIAAVRRAAFSCFYAKEKGAFRTFAGEEHYSDLSNALALLSGCAGDCAPAVAEKIANGGMIETSLAMKIFEYDALLSVSENYRGRVLSDLACNYGYMLNCGATSFWETLEGEKQYGGAGSLCHGWSATPVVYLWRLGEVFKPRAQRRQEG